MGDMSPCEHGDFIGYCAKCRAERRAGRKVMARRLRAIVELRRKVSRAMRLMAKLMCARKASRV
jgi:hypothetical protein